MTQSDKSQASTTTSSTIGLKLLIRRCARYTSIDMKTWLRIRHQYLKASLNSFLEFLISKALTFGSVSNKLPMLMRVREPSIHPGLVVLLRV